MDLNYCTRFGRTFRNAAFGIAALTAASALSSCESFYIDEGDCDPHYYVKFDYTMNMEWADAFSNQVNSVELYVFDASTGDFVAKYTESDLATLSAPGYRMPVDLTPGKTYDFIAWCGLDNNQENLFSLPQSISHRDHVNCRMERMYEGDRAYQNKQLHYLFHGKETALLPDEQGEHEVLVHLIKDTNNINISMQHISGQPLTTDMFSVTMTEGNGHLAHDNSLVQDEDIDFKPWHVDSGMVDITGSRADDDENLNFFMAEISTSRLMANRDPRINIVDNATGNVVYSIPIVKWATTFRSQQFKDNNNNMHVITDNQEYLDRESNYNVMLYLDNKEDGGWLAASIYINSWKVVLQSKELD